MRLPITIPVENGVLEEIAAVLAAEPGFVCLEGLGGGGRFALCACRPGHAFSIAGGFVTVDGHTTIDSPGEALRRFCAQVSGLGFDPYLPFSGGIVGTIGYEGARALRGLEPAAGFSRHSQCRLGFYPAAILFDRVEGTARIVANGATLEEAEAAAEELQERLAAHEGTFLVSKEKRPPVSRDTGAEAIPTFTCDTAAHRELTSVARSWVRSEHVRRLHLVQREVHPAAGAAPIEILFTRTDECRTRGLFTHEGAAYIVGASEVPFTAESLPAKIDALLAMLPARAQTGEPYDRALDFIERHETAHRHLYGGAFGVMDAGRMTFWPAERVETIADGQTSTVTGVDVTAG